MCVFVLNLTIHVVVGKAIVEQASEGGMEDIKSDNVESEAKNLLMKTFSESVDVSPWSDVSEVPKKAMVSTGCGTSLAQTKIGSEKVKNNEVESAQQLEKKKKLISTSTGTSPPPQSISTQVSIFKIFIINISISMQLINYVINTMILVYVIHDSSTFSSRM